MPIKRKPFKLSVQDGDPIRCVLMCFPGNRKEVYCAIPDIDKFLQSQYTGTNTPAEGVLEEWEVLQDRDIVGLNYYSLSVLPWLIPMKSGNAPVRDRMVRLIRIATRTAENLKP